VSNLRATFRMALFLSML